MSNWMKKVVREYLDTIRKPYGGLRILVDESLSTLEKMQSVRLDNVFLSLPGVCVVTAVNPSLGISTSTKKSQEEMVEKSLSTIQ
jgi:hypothetical protein